MLTLLLTQFIDLLLTPQVAFQELRLDLNLSYCTNYGNGQSKVAHFCSQAFRKSRREAKLHGLIF